MRRMRIVGAVVAVLAVVALAACGSSGSGKASGKTSAPSKAAASEPRFEKRGPYEVGVTTLSLPDRKVEVYYPAERGSTKGKPQATYEQTDGIPANLLATLPKPPPDVDLTVPIPAVRDVPVASGHFPLVLFSHGAGGWRTVYGMPLSGIASWGFVVASTDYTEYGLVAQFTGATGDAATRATKVHDVATATLDLMTRQNRERGRFHDSIDTKRIAAVGHSAGGGTMFGLLDDRRVRTIVGWAPVGPSTPVTSHTPTMIIAGAKDIAITPAAATKDYDELLSPKRLVVVGNMGHNAFSDTCLAFRKGTDLVGIAQRIGITIPDRLAALARNGCEPGDLDTAEGWRIIQHFTVAELRDELGTDKTPVGLGTGITRAFPGVTIDYREQLR